MKKININQLYEFYLETIRCCSSKLLLEDDGIIEYYLFEVLDANVHSFLHDDVLHQLLIADLINKSMFEKSILLRKKVFKLLDDTREVAVVKSSIDWQNLFILGDEILKEISGYAPSYS